MLTEMKPLVRQSKGTTKFSARYPNALWREVEKLAELTGESLTDTVIALLEEAVKARKEDLKR